MSIQRDKDKKLFIVPITDEFLQDIRCIMGSDPAHLLGDIIYTELMSILDEERKQKENMDKFSNHLRF